MQAWWALVGLSLRLCLYVCIYVCMYVRNYNLQLKYTSLRIVYILFTEVEDSEDKRQRQNKSRDIEYRIHEFYDLYD